MLLGAAVHRAGVRSSGGGGCAASDLRILYADHPGTRAPLGREAEARPRWAASPQAPILFWAPRPQRLMASAAAGGYSLAAQSRRQPAVVSTSGRSVSSLPALAWARCRRTRCHIRRLHRNLTATRGERCAEVVGDADGGEREPHKPLPSRPPHDQQSSAGVARAGLGWPGLAGIVELDGSGWC